MNIESLPDLGTLLVGQELQWVGGVKAQVRRDWKADQILEGWQGA